MSKVAISTPLVVSMEDTLKSWKMQRASSIPYPFDTQRATLKMEDMVDILRKLDFSTEYPYVEINIYLCII